MFDGTDDNYDNVNAFRKSESSLYENKYVLAFISEIEKNISE